MITPCTTLTTAISSGSLDNDFRTLYGQENIKAQKRRYLHLLEQFGHEKPDAQTFLVNAPGRTELAGNHTDHNNGCVLAAAVDLDCIAAITPVDTPEVTLFSEDYFNPIQIDLGDLSPRPEEQGTPESLVRGVAASFFNRTGCRQGFSGRLHATCLPGTGLSSSAAFSVLIGAAFNVLSHKKNLSPETLALMAREAENDFFGKPCGLMDQMASAIGRTIFIDFLEPEKPLVQRIDYSLEGTGYKLAIINTGGSHVELTPEYGAIPQEIKAASEVLGQPFARGITIEKFRDNINKIRNQTGDRATLRLMHFIEENERVQKMIKSLRQNNFSTYLQQVKESGMSSCCLLQNCASASSSREQGILLALAMSRQICTQAVCRVHGGGFAGTVQAYVPEEHFNNYSHSMEQIFGNQTVLPVRIGRPGVCYLNEKGLILPNEE